MKRVKRITTAAALAFMLLQSSVHSAEAVSDAPATIGETAAESVQQRRVAVVIDDFGNNMKGTDEMFKLPVPITAAVMPFMPTTREDAEEAHRLGLDVIVHMPMEPNQGKRSWLGPGALVSTMTDAEVRQAVEKAIEAVPHAVGMNNHMGSKITADERIMRVVLAVCKERGLFFLDSRTTYKTVIPKVAKELGVPLLNNDVFLDDVYTAGHISKQITVLMKKSKEQADCITIGHVGVPGVLTSTALRQAAASMSGTRFVRASELLPASAEEKLVLPNS
ncbi:divergent polysaccharide deacetylase family protein [Paenibacillus pasadenensis]|uniref:divergent polysaccharide deacetylase family protein n=1 Tax=Paenibacillus pasadenensis TaxID=217090 RepID=UPI00203D536E|nr:divergent polysaccharide deacetylase family protein [Paenibacillus pasadenensis]MCM3747199.1 divergent polysaccharide deacetylase family protein [Paenibacillus pasadenensis]